MRNDPHEIERDNYETRRKPLVLLHRDKTSKILVTFALLLFLVALGCLDHLFGMNDSVFPSWEAGYHSVSMRDPVFNVREDLGVEYVEGGSWASICRGVLPAMLIMYFSFMFGFGSVGCDGRNTWFFFCLACMCIICYCLAWIVPPEPIHWLIIRVLLFSVASLILLLSLGCRSLLRYKKCHLNDPLLSILLNTHLKGASSSSTNTKQEKSGSGHNIHPSELLSKQLLKKAYQQPDPNYLYSLQLLQWTLENHELEGPWKKDRQRLIDQVNQMFLWDHKLVQKLLDLDRLSLEEKDPLQLGVFLAENLHHSLEVKKGLA